MKNKSQRITEYNHLILNKCKYQIGDSVSVLEEESSIGHGRIQKIWRKNSTSDAFIEIIWYYNPKEVFKALPDFISESELFDSNLKQNLSVRTICEKIQVLSLYEYHQLDLVGPNVFFVRGFYDYKKKTITPSIFEWERVCYCDKIINPDLVYVKCDGCNQLFHVECSGCALETESSWYCKKCNC